MLLDGPQRPSTTSIPDSTRPSFGRGSFPVRSVRPALSRVTSCETLATDSFGRPVSFGGRSTFPGALAHLRLLVRATQTTVAIRLRFSPSPCTTTTGRRNPGSEPLASGRSAHQTSPWAIVTSRYASEHGERPHARMGRSVRRSRPALDPSPRSRDRERAAPRTPQAPGCTLRCETASFAEPVAQPLRISRPERTQLFSYRQYNRIESPVKPCPSKRLRDGRRDRGPKVRLGWTGSASAREADLRCRAAGESRRSSLGRIRLLGAHGERPRTHWYSRRAASLSMAGGYVATGRCSKRGADVQAGRFGTPGRGTCAGGADAIHRSATSCRATRRDRP